MLELGEVRPGAPMRWKLGGLTMRSTFAVVNPGRELTWTGRFLGYKAVDQHLLEPAGNGRTTVTIRESLAGPLLPLLYRPSQLQAGHQRWLTALKTTLERRLTIIPSIMPSGDFSRVRCASTGCFDRSGAPYAENGATPNLRERA